MRQLIMMEMRAEDDHKLFWTVDEAWNKDGIIFTFPLIYGDEARNRIADLGPWVNHHRGARAIKKYFTPAAAERAINSTWDTKNNRAISQEEEAMDDLLDCIDNDMSYMGDPKAETKIDMSQVSQAPNTSNLRPTNLFNYDPNEDPSLGTLRQSSVQGGNQQVPNLAVQQNNIVNSNSTSKNDMVDTDELTYDGDQTIDTLSSRMSNLETYMLTMSKNMSFIAQNLKSVKQNNMTSTQENDSDDASSESDEDGDDADGDNTDKTTRSSAGNAKSNETGDAPAESQEDSVGGP